jgi:hypothetical protein
MESKQVRQDRTTTLRSRKWLAGVAAMLLGVSLLAGCSGVGGGGTTAPSADATATLEPAPPVEEVETPEVSDSEEMTDTEGTDTEGTDTEGVGDTDTMTDTEGMDDTDTMTDTEGMDDSDTMTDTEGVGDTDTMTDTEGTDELVVEVTQVSVWLSTSSCNYSSLHREM